MIVLKKLIFAPIFLIVSGLLVTQLAPLTSSYDLIFSLSKNALVQLITISLLASLSSLLFVLFASIAHDWKFFLPIGIASSLTPLLFMEQPLAFIFTVAIFISLLFTYISLETTLNSYLNFQPNSLLSPATRHLSTLLILSFCVVYFLSMGKLISQNGFQIPDSLIDTAVKMASVNTPGEPSVPNELQNITPEQLQLLKKNPDLLRQYGLEPKILDNLNPTTSPSSTTSVIKQTVKDQIQGFTKPYLSFLPALLALLLFLAFQTLTSIINLLIYPLLWIIFFILEKTGFVKFEIEQRPVRKLVV